MTVCIYTSAVSGIKIYFTSDDIGLLILPDEWPIHLGCASGQNGKPCADRWAVNQINETQQYIGHPA